MAILDGEGSRSDDAKQEGQKAGRGGKRIQKQGGCFRASGLRELFLCYLGMILSLTGREVSLVLPKTSM